MQPADELLGNSIGAESYWCLAKPGELYLVYLPWSDPATLDLRGVSGEYSVQWFNPRTGAALQNGTISTIKGEARARLGTPPVDEVDDWVALVRRVAR